MGGHLPKRVVVGVAREAADEDRAVGVTGGLGVAERVVWNGTGAKPQVREGKRKGTAGGEGRVGETRTHRGRPGSR
jgi:hypothetical protein